MELIAQDVSDSSSLNASTTQLWKNDGLKNFLPASPGAFLKKYSVFLGKRGKKNTTRN
jgi:hypothetical protein